MEETSKIDQLFTKHLQFSKKYSRLLILSYIAIGLSGCCLYYLFLTFFEIRGIGASFTLFALAALISELPDLWPYAKGILPSASKNSYSDNAKIQLKRVEYLIHKSKTMILLVSICFFIGITLAILGALFWKNKFGTGLGIGLTLLSAVKWVVDLFIQWQRLEFVRLMKKVI